MKSKISKLYDSALRVARGKARDLTKARQLLEQAHRRGDRRATYALGSWYLHGKSNVIKKDTKLAVKFLRQAAKAGIADAAFDLAVCNEKGDGVSRSSKIAFQLYLKAALHGDPQAVYEVGRCHWHGIGVKKDRVIANEWLDYAGRLRVLSK